MPKKQEFEMAALATPQSCPSTGIMLGWRKRNVSQPNNICNGFLLLPLGTCPPTGIVLGWGKTPLRLQAKPKQEFSLAALATLRLSLGLASCWAEFTGKPYRSPG